MNHNPFTQPPENLDEDITPDPRRDGAEEDATAKPEVTLLVDARNGFNEVNRRAMLWNVRHRWPKGARFAFN